MVRQGYSAQYRDIIMASRQAWNTVPRYPTAEYFLERAKVCERRNQHNIAAAYRRMAANLTYTYSM